MKVKSLSGVQLLATPWTAAHQVPLSMEFSRPGDLPDPGIKPRSPILQAHSLPAEPQGKPKNAVVGSLSLLQGIYPTQDSKGVSYISRQIFFFFLTTEPTEKALKRGLGTHQIS